MRTVVKYKSGEQPKYHDVILGGPIEFGNKGQRYVCIVVRQGLNVYTYGSDEDNTSIYAKTGKLKLLMISFEESGLQGEWSSLLDTRGNAENFILLTRSKPARRKHVKFFRLP